jgi:hypothetical protein
VSEWRDVSRRDVGRVLLGSWPSQVSSWGREGIAAYVLELQERGLTPEAAVAALRRWPDKWPPAAGELVCGALVDPAAPTFDEMLLLVRRAAKTAEPEKYLAAQHPLVGSFVARQGWDRLRTLPVDCPDWGEKTRRELREAWDRHVETGERREIAALASGGALRQLDPLAALQLGSASHGGES